MIGTSVYKVFQIHDLFIFYYGFAAKKYLCDFYIDIVAREMSKVIKKQLLYSQIFFDYVNKKHDV